jgi:hypothetical protein
MFENLRENLSDSIFVILQNLGYSDTIQIDLIFLV